MLKTVLLASAMMISVPAFAQDMNSPQQTPQTTPPTEQVPPATDDATTAPTQATPPADAATPDQATAPTQAPTTAQQAQATPAAGQPATGPAQVAQVVNTEFPSYDKNADGNLDKTEFGSWMVALKTASDPTTKAGDPATEKWVSGAFASADTDKSAMVSKDELTAYLAKSVSG